MVNPLNHLKTVNKHRYEVLKLCMKCGIPLQGIVHDLSKYSPSEFIPSIHYWTGKISPIDVETEKKGYSTAWLHHKGRNKHHYEYWTDNYDSGTTYIEIPEKYVRELVADWFAAGRTYNGKEFTIDDELKWWNDCKDSKFIHPNTKKRITELMTGLKYLS